jgi:hypothetical protein
VERSKISSEIFTELVVAPVLSPIEIMKLLSLNVIFFPDLQHNNKLHR